MGIKPRRSYSEAQRALLEAMGLKWTLGQGGYVYLTHNERPVGFIVEEDDGGWIFKPTATLTATP